MRITNAKTFLTLLTLLAPVTTSIPARAWERGPGERFATLPAGESPPEGICEDREGNVYVVTVAADKPDTSGGTLLVFDPNGKQLRTVTIPASTPWLLDLRFHPQTGQLLVVDYKGAKVLAVEPGDEADYRLAARAHAARGFFKLQLCARARPAPGGGGYVPVGL